LSQSGGTVLSQLLSSSDPAIKSSKISALVRRQDQADILAANGVHPIIFKDLDDLEALKCAAREHDVVISSASSFHPPSTKALIQGLGEKKKQTAGSVYFIHVSKIPKAYLMAY
jgi:putative NADH-flavin reductase